MPEKLEELKMGHGKQEIVIKHNLNNNDVIMLLNLYDNFPPTWIMFLLFILILKMKNTLMIFNFVSFMAMCS
jgi:hypothetical protein